MSKPKKAKKQNPRNIPATLADVEKARSDGIEKGLLLCVWTLVDSKFLTPEQITEFAQAVNKTAESISERYIKWKDIEVTLTEEYQVQLDI